jgi:hypothetical protein
VGAAEEKMLDRAAKPFAIELVDVVCVSSASLDGVVVIERVDCRSDLKAIRADIVCIVWE